MKNILVSWNLIFLMFSGQFYNWVIIRTIFSLKKFWCLLGNKLLNNISHSAWSLQNITCYSQPFFNPIFIPCFSGSMFFQGLGFSRSRLFWLQVFRVRVQGPGFRMDRGFQGRSFPVSRSRFRIQVFSLST